MKQIIKKFNNLVKKTIFKVQNKTNNNFNISDFNKYLITFFALLFIYLFYLLIPLLYDKTWVQTNIESKLLNEFRINISTSADISYRILPSPHFLIKDSKILVGKAEKKKFIADIKYLKIFLSQRNFLNKKRMKFQKVVINNANFSLSKNDFKLIDNYQNKKFSNKKIIINKSNIFFKNNLDEIDLILKVDKAFLFFEDKKLLNLATLSGEVFNIPFIFNLKKQIYSNETKTININAKDLRLNIFNESNKTDQDLVSGKNIISFLNSTISTKYYIKKKIITFKSRNPRMKNLRAIYSGKLSINPFDLGLNVNLNDYKISKLFNINPILNEFIKSGLLFNENISLNTSIVANSNSKEEIFQHAKINFQIINGKINFDKTKLVSDEIGIFEFNNSNLLLRDNKIMLNTEILIEIENSEALFSFFNTNKKLRKNFQTIFINLDYDFLNNQIKFNNLKINNIELNDQLLTINDSFYYNDLTNFNKSRQLVNKLFKAYAG